MPSKRRVQITIEPALYERAKKVATKKYNANFSEYLRYLIRRDLTESPKPGPKPETESSPQ